MTTEAKYTFISYLRKGLAAQLKIGDALGEITSTTIKKVSVDVKITLEGTDPDSTQNDFIKEYNVVGPGEILGINENVVVRKSPNPGDRSFSPSFIPFIEFYSEDFPWRFTPLAAVKPSGQTDEKYERVRPWVTLVVLAEYEFLFDPPRQGLPSSFTLDGVDKDEVFPSEKNIWAWAHIQVNKAVTNLVEFESALSDNPDNAISRILCPRKLKPFTKYHAFLIPTFLRGLQAGLGKPIDANIQVPAWEVDSPSDNQFPYYLTWQFSTEDYTDFESLASRIKPGLPSPDLGKLKLDISELNYPDLENWMAVNAFDGILEMDGILRPPPGMAPIDDEIKETYRKLINLTDDYKTLDDQTIGDVYLNGKDADPESIDPIVTIPFYGQWYAAKTRADESEDEYWLNTMNLDPRYRLAIGVGSEIVRKKSDDLLKRAWKQSGNLLHVNKTLRLLQHSYLVSSQILNKNLSLPEEELLSLFGPMLKRVLIACNYPGTTVNPPSYVGNPPPLILTPVTLGFTLSQFTAINMGTMATVTWTIMATETLGANLDINLTETGQGGQLSSLIATITAGNSSTSIVRNYNMTYDSYNVYMAIEGGVNYNTDNEIDSASSQIPPMIPPEA